MKSDNELSTEEFIEAVFASIREKRPFSFIRFNDGEARIVGRTKYYPPIYVIEQLTKYFGDNLVTGRELEALVARVLQAVRNASVIGLPPASWPKSFSCARRIVYDEIGSDSKPTVPVDLHQYLFKSDFFDRLFSDGAQINLITCRDVKDYLKNRYGASDLQVLFVPEQADGSFSWDIAPHFPDYCDCLVEHLSRNAGNRIYLVGAGVCGKLYCEAVRSGGGVAIDIGSIFDLWAGRFSRDYMESGQIRSYYQACAASFNFDQNIIRASAEIYAREKQYMDALRVLDWGVRHFPECTDLRMRAIHCMTLSGEMQRAEEQTTILMRSGGLSAAQLVVIAKVFKTAENPVFEIQCLMAAFERNRLNVSALIQLLNRVVAGDISGSLADQILDAAKVAARCENHMLMFQLARTLGASGDIDLAIDYGARAIEVFDCNPAYLEHQIAWLRVRGRSKDAERYVEILAHLNQKEDWTL